MQHLCCACNPFLFFLYTWSPTSVVHGLLGFPCWWVQQNNIKLSSKLRQSVFTYFMWLEVLGWHQCWRSSRLRWFHCRFVEVKTNGKVAYVSVSFLLPWWVWTIWRNGTNSRGLRKVCHGERGGMQAGIGLRWDKWQTADGQKVQRVIWPLQLVFSNWKQLDLPFFQFLCN